MKIAFFGTHNFAATILEGIINNPLFDIQLVITQPDKPVGRKQKTQKSPVKLLAEKHGLQIAQPNSLKTCTLAQLHTCELGICAQYGLIFPPNILNAPKMGILNFHTSLLPKYRGASPIESQILADDREAGVSILLLDAEMDHGPTIAQKNLQLTTYNG
ncbi:MAG: methionyl-tRNA formyltransferase [Candidatus Magasanikbacteria bacterium]|nr:methionyl-tRNA formyltransferase [Candidatus Magasanikbacteria bacterium]